MKKYILLFSLTFFFLSLFSQHGENAGTSNANERDELKTIIGPDVSNGGYGALSLGYTQIEGQHAFLTGGRGAWIIGHKLGLGLAGYGFINDPVFDDLERLYYNLSGGYGAFLIEPILFGRWPVHLSFPILAGAGGIARASFSEDLFTQGEPAEAYLEEATLFLIAEPGAELEFNLLQWMRLSVFGSYRFTSNLNMIDVGPNALVGWSAGVTLKVGIF